MLELVNIFKFNPPPLTASLAVKYPYLLDDYQIDEKTSFHNMDKLFETDKMRYHVIFIPSLLGSQLLALASIDKRTNPATIDMVSHAGPHCCCGNLDKFSTLMSSSG